MSVLIENKVQLQIISTGHVSRFRISLLRTFAVAGMFLAGVSLQGCGGGGEGSTVSPISQTTNVAVTSPVDQATASLIATNYLQVVDSDYHFAATPTFYYSTDNQSFWSIQANVARSVTDINSRTVIRIDIPKTGAPLPQLNKTFAIETGTSIEQFPGTILVLDGQQSTRKRVETGTINFSPDSAMTGHVSGSFSVVFTDYDASVTPAPRYFLNGIFSFKMGGFGAAS